MADILHIAQKQSKQFLFEVKLNRLARKRGILSSNDVNENLHVATSKKFGGEGKEWSAEHLFLGALSSCFMSTYLFFADKSGLEISRFECDTIGQIEEVEGRYQFTHINIYPKIYLADEGLKEKASLCLQKTQKHCLVSNSIKAEIIYHAEVLKDPQAQVSLLEA